MRNLNTYIIEKLHLNKDSKLTKSFLEGDKVCFLELYFNNAFDDKIYLRIRQPFTIKYFDKEKITYTVPFNGKELEEKIYFNSKGYYQSDRKESGGKNTGRIYSYTIYLTSDDYKNFLEIILKEKAFNPKYKEIAKEKIIKLLKDKYFDIDKVNIEELDNRELLYYDMSHKGYCSSFKKPKEFKEFIDKYY